MEDLGLLANKIKQLFCKHDYVTITNFYGDMINNMSISSKKIIRSVQQCRKCKKIHKSEKIDKNCHIVNFDMYRNETLGIWRNLE